MQKVTHILEEKMSCCSDFLPHEKWFCGLNLIFGMTKPKWRKRQSFPRR
jgi:hypothetical protein